MQLKSNDAQDALISLKFIKKWIKAKTHAFA